MIDIDQFFEARFVANSVSDKPIIVIIVAIVSGVMKLSIRPMIPVINDLQIYEMKYFEIYYSNFQDEQMPSVSPKPYGNFCLVTITKP